MDGPSDSAPDRLVGWKEIAAHLGRSVRAVQRWEQELGLPVRRVRTPAGQSVYASRRELDEWLAGSGAAERARAEEDPEPAPDGASRHGSMLRAVVGGLGLLALGAVAAWFFTGRHAVPRGALFRVVVVRNEVRAFDEQGRPLWTHHLPRARPPQFAPTWPHSVDPTIVDLDRDGLDEALVALAFAPTPQEESASEALYCFSRDGKVRWTYTPSGTLSFEGGATFGPRWVISAYTVSPGAPRRVWVSVTDGTWWATKVDRIDAAGTPRTQLVHGGIFYTLAATVAGGRDLLIAAGVSNEHRSAGYAVIDADAPPGRWPQEPSQFRCVSCPTGAPLRYVLLPPSDLIAAEGTPYNRVLSIRGGDTLTLQTIEQHDPHFGAPGLLYRLSKDGRPLGFAPSDGYAELHARYEAAGRLDHPSAECQDITRPRRTRMWTPEQGWHEVIVPVDPVAFPPGPE